MISIRHIDIVSGIYKSKTLYQIFIRNLLFIHEHFTIIFIRYITLFSV